MKAILTPPILILLSLSLALGAAEFGLRLYLNAETGVSGKEIPWFRESEDASLDFEPDYKLGFVPRIPSAKYDEFGTVRSASSAKTKSSHRVLFLGDSVTYRGFVSSALEQLSPDSDVSFYTSAVPAYNTMQEVEFFERYSAKLNAGQVILLFHLNDFQHTPLVARDKHGKLAAFTPDGRLSSAERYLLQNSYLYRLAAKAVEQHSGEWSEVVEDVGRALAKLNNLVLTRGGNLTVVVLPLAKPVGQWTAAEAELRTTAVHLLRANQIRYLDAFPALIRAEQQGIVLGKGEK